MSLFSETASFEPSGERRGDDDGPGGEGQRGCLLPSASNQTAGSVSAPVLPLRYTSVPWAEGAEEKSNCPPPLVLEPATSSRMGIGVPRVSRRARENGTAKRVP